MVKIYQKYIVCKISDILWMGLWIEAVYIDGIVQDCRNSIANALELLQSCTKPSMCPPIAMLQENDIGLALNMKQAIIKTNDDPDYWQICVTRSATGDVYPI